MQENLVYIENAQLEWVNFAGRRTEYNAEGNRNFHVVIDSEQSAEDLKRIGLNVKFKADYKHPDGRYVLKVNVNYDTEYPPRIFLITNTNKVLLDGESVKQLDNMRIISADLEINPHHWSKGKNEGVSAYIRTMYVTIEEDRFAYKYRDLAEGGNL